MLSDSATAEVTLSTILLVGYKTAVNGDWEQMQSWQAASGPYALDAQPLILGRSPCGQKGPVIEEDISSFSTLAIISGYLKSRADSFPLLWPRQEAGSLPLWGHVGTLLSCDASLLRAFLPCSHGCPGSVTVTTDAADWLNHLQDKVTGEEVKPPSTLPWMRGDSPKTQGLIPKHLSETNF